MDNLQTDFSEEMRRGDEAQHLRVAADERIKQLERSKKIVLDGSPPGYTICVVHGDLVRCVDGEGKWVEAAGVCEFCWKENLARREKLSRPQMEVRPEEAAPVETGLDGGRQGQTAPVGDVPGLQTQDALVSSQSERTHVQPLVAGGSHGQSGGDPWDVIFGFPASELRR